MSSEPTDPDEGFPIYRAQRTPEAVPGFLGRALERMRVDPPEGDFTVEGVDFEIAQAVWLAPIGAYDPEQDTPSTPDEVAAGASPTGPWGAAMLDWEVGVRSAMRQAWGEPVVHTPRLVGSEQEPEGILDYLLVAQEIPQAELWDRGELFVALLTHWAGEPAASYLTQAVVLLPRELVMGGMSALMDEDTTTHERLMHGEHPVELRRRAWLMCTMFGPGEVRLRDTAIEATRCSVEARDGTTTVWIFADDGRQLVLIQDPSCALAEWLQTVDDGVAADNSIDPVRSETQLIHIERLLDGVPQDLRACIAARGETVRGEIAGQALEFGLLDDRPVPVITGAAWFDGEAWHVTRGLMELGYRNGFGMDDFGFAEAVRRPYRLGGTFTLDDIAPDDDARRRLQPVFDACPFPEQPRPEGDVRLGYGVPTSVDSEGIVDAVERASEAWWDREPAQAPLGDDTFSVGGRTLGDRDDTGVLHTVLAIGERWTVDALQAWTDRLGDAMSERWGRSREVQVEDAHGVERRTPLSRVMRGTGLRAAPLWWVNGHAVVVLAGFPDPTYSREPQVILAICRPDTLLELLRRTSIWETRLRARVIRNLAALVAESEGMPATEQHVAAEQPIAWEGPPLAGTQVVPLATRGGLRTGTFFWVWHFTHDGRGLLTSHEIGGTPGDFAAGAELFSGVPDDLLSLVVDREPPGPYPVVRRAGQPELPGRLGGARSLPDAVAVFFYDGVDWRAPMGMLRRVRSAGAEDPIAALYSAEVGVPQLQWALRAGAAMSRETLAEVDYGSFVLSRAVSLEEAGAAFEELCSSLEAALTGTLNEVLDAIIDGPGGYRVYLDAALSNPDPRNRREIALWLLGEQVDASQQLSSQTPVNVLLANPTLDGGDAVLLRRLLGSGADAGFGLLGPRPGGHPLVQLCDRDMDESELEPLLDVLLVREIRGEPVPRYDVTAPVLPDGRSLLDHVRAGHFPHARSRARLRERLERLA